MSTALESDSFFMQRAKQLGILQADLDKLKTKKLSTYGAFAFLSPYSSQNADPALLKNALETVLGADVSEEQMPFWRRLQFDAHTHLLSEARQAVERTESSEPRKVPMPEKAARLDEIKKRLNHLVITPDIEPSHSLIDLVSQMIEEGVLRYIPIEVCTSRRQEMMTIKKEPAVKIDAAGSFKLIHKAQSDKADTSSDLFIRLAFQRRSIVFDMCRMMSYIEHEKWICSLFSQLSHVPPPGYAPVSMEQILTADRELWTLVAEKCRNGLRVDAAGTYLVEKEFLMLQNAPPVTYAMLPLPMSAKSSDRKRKSPDSNRSQPKASDKKHARTADGKSSKGGKSGKGQNRNDKESKGSIFFNNFPELRGMWYKVRGCVVCAKFNLGECQDVQPGETCSRGKHICCYPKCFELHSMKAFHNK